MGSSIVVEQKIAAAAKHETEHQVECEGLGAVVNLRRCHYGYTTVVATE